LNSLEIRGDPWSGYLLGIPFWGTNHIHFLVSVTGSHGVVSVFLVERVGPSGVAVFKLCLFAVGKGVVFVLVEEV
jgi:hypothetical protein